MKNIAITKAERGLNGHMIVPGDKSISHRAVLISSLCSGISHFSNFLCSIDCMSSIKCMSRMGVKISLCGDRLEVNGVGLRGLKCPDDALNVRNSGTTARLLSGILSAQDFNSTIDGDDSIRKRPMKRVIDPLILMGVKIAAKENNFCPIEIFASRSSMRPIKYSMPVKSAQVKSAILLAGLYADGITCVEEHGKTRDHTEKMLSLAGVQIFQQNLTVSVKKADRLHPLNMRIPGDISSAAYFIVAALIIPKSEIIIKNVGYNKTRTGIIDVLIKMGADIQIINVVLENEPTCDIMARSSHLFGTIVEGEIIPSLIDEVPILCVAALFSQGNTIIRDAGELKYKESNRILSLYTELKKAGANILKTADGFEITGGGDFTPSRFECYKDHRIAMALTIFALMLDGQSIILDAECVNVSYPHFFNALKLLIG